MDDPAVTAKQLVDLAKKHIEEPAVPHRTATRTLS